MEGNVFDPKRIHLREEDGVLWLEENGERTELDPPKRALPLSSPAEWIMLSSIEGEELGIVRRVSELDSTSQRMLRAALEQAYRITTITRVLEVEREPVSGQIAWRVEIESDEHPNSEDDLVSGKEVTFHLSGGEDVQTARYPHIYFTDLDGNRFQILNCEAMDLPSRRASERYF